MASHDSHGIDITAPVRVGLGLLTAGAAEVGRRLPGPIVRLPIQLLNGTLHAAELAAKGYEELARRGEQTMSAVRRRIGLGGDGTDSTLYGARGGSGPAYDPYTGGPLEPVDDIRESVWLSPEDTETVAEATEGSSLERADLPLEDYDHLTLGSLRARIRRLGVAELVQLREYEQAHANRLPVMKTLDARITKLAQESQPATP
jgi:hypothetical protein